MEHWSGDLHVKRFLRRKRTREQIEASEADLDRIAEEFRAKNSTDNTTHSESNPRGNVQKKADAPQ
jgi:hypothetical protein